MTVFGKSGKSLLELMVEAVEEALLDSGVDNIRFDEVIVGNMASLEFKEIPYPACYLVSELGLEPANTYRIENTSASGASAVHMGWRAVLSGDADYVLVVGVEKMSNLATGEAAEVISRVLHEEERRQGVTLPSLAALLASSYMSRYGAPREALAKVAVKNHYHASLNPKAHLRKRITVEDVLNSPIVAEPLRRYDFCPISDGAAALILTTYENAERFRDSPVVLSAVASATDSQTLAERSDLLVLNAVRKACEKAYRISSKKPNEIDVAEIHDMSTILEIVLSEELGFFRRGEGWRAVERGETTLSGRLPINPSGGLKARGHPLGATGVAQLVELAMQLEERCGERQVNARTGLACNLGGFAQGAVVSILERVGG